MSSDVVLFPSMLRALYARDMSCSKRRSTAMNSEYRRLYVTYAMVSCGYIIQIVKSRLPSECTHTLSLCLYVRTTWRYTWKLHNGFMQYCIRELSLEWKRCLHKTNVCTKRIVTVRKSIFQCMSIDSRPIIV